MALVRAWMGKRCKVRKHDETGGHPYEARLRRVIQYIFDNPAGDLSLDMLAEVAAMSRFHWHRVHHAMTGETCAQAVRRIRAHRAACWLVQTDWPLTEVARKAGYDNPQSFARAFRGQYGMTPAAFRTAGTPDPQSLTLRQGEPDMYPFEIRETPSLRLAALPHRGAYPEIGRAFGQVAAVFTAQGLWPQACGMVGVYYDSPADVPEAELRSHAGIVVGADLSLPSDLQEVLLPGGRHGVLTLTGPYSGLAAAWDHLYRTALPNSGAEPADRPAFEVYLNDPSDCAPADLVTEIHVPLKG